MNMNKLTTINVLKTTILTILLINLSACVTVAPKNIKNACYIAQHYPKWYYDSLDSYNKWGVPINVQWAFIRKESSFIGDIKPAKKYVFGFIPWGHISSSYGYSQALNGTWNDYKKKSGNSSASRSNFADSVDFIGWYGNRANKYTGMDKNNAYELYLAYYSGIGGYKKGKFSAISKKYARITQGWASEYAYQLQNCKIPSRPWFAWY